MVYQEFANECVAVAIGLMFLAAMFFNWPNNKKLRVS